ncbi:MAG: hypothetical protein LQ340_005570, partial [Diploschistes diacapsis]
MGSYTITALKRWSVQEKQMPAVSRIKALHVYDFDNTLFLSPLPNPKLWYGRTIDFLKQQDCLVNGGWWHDKSILEATGEGMDKEEPRAWEGWWNEDIVQTRAAEAGFADTIKRMAAAKKLEFDMICLKPLTGPNGQRFPSTMLYKQALLKDIIFTYREIEELKIYEDRPKHVAGFRQFIDVFKRDLRDHPSSVSRKDLAGEVIPVADTAGALDPLTETREVQRMLNSHNLSTPSPRLLIKRTVFFLGYLLSQSDTDNLLTLLDFPPSEPLDTKLLGNNIMITPRPSTASVLEKVGGQGAKQIWQVTGFGQHSNLVFAARVAPIPSSATYFTENPVPMVVLACRKGGKAVDSTRINNWTPVPSDKQFVFETTVGEKVQLRIEEEMEGQTEYEALFPPKKDLLPWPVGAGVKRKALGPADDAGNERPPREEGSRRVSDRYRGSAHPHRDGGGRGGRGGRDRDRDRDRERENGHRNGPPPGGRGGRNGDRRDRRDDRRDRDCGGGRDRDHDRNRDRERDGGDRSGDRGGVGGARRGGRNGYRSLDDVADGPRNE